MDVEDLTEDELKVIRKYYTQMSNLSKKDESLVQLHSLDEANQQHKVKKARKREQNQSQHPQIKNTIKKPHPIKKHPIAGSSAKAK